MASLKQRPDGVWRARYRDAAGKEHARHFPLKREAQRWLNEVATAVVTGQYVDPNAGKAVWRAWTAAWMDRQTWAPGTRDAAQTAISSVSWVDEPIGGGEAVACAGVGGGGVEAWPRGIDDQDAAQLCADGVSRRCARQGDPREPCRVCPCASSSEGGGGDEAADRRAGGGVAERGWRL